MALSTIVLCGLACGPAFAAIVAIIVVAFSIKKGFNKLRGEVINTKEYQSVKEQLAVAHRENSELKKMIKDLIKKIDRVDKGD